MNEPYGTGNVWQPPDARDAELARLRAELAERYAEIALLREANSTFASAAIKLDEPRTEAEWKAADRRERINDLAARYAGQVAAGAFSRLNTVAWVEIVAIARALAAAVVEAEE